MLLFGLESFGKENLLLVENGKFFLKNGFLYFDPILSDGDLHFGKLLLIVFEVFPDGLWIFDGLGTFEGLGVFAFEILMIFSFEILMIFGLFFEFRSDFIGFDFLELIFEFFELSSFVCITIHSVGILLDKLNNDGPLVLCSW